MQTQKLQLTDIRYNPAHSAFEAIVKIHDKGEVFSYATHVSAPLTASFGHISRGLSRKAQDAHRAPVPGMRLRRRNAAIAETNAPAPLVVLSPFMRRVFDQLAA